RLVARAAARLRVRRNDRPNDVRRRRVRRRGRSLPRRARLDAVGMRLQEKVALVTGGGSGIGRAVCTRFAEEGAHVVVTSRTAEHVEAVAREAEAALAFPLDVADGDSVRAGVERVVERFGRIDVLSNNAGIELTHAP